MLVQLWAVSAGKDLAGLASDPSLAASLNVMMELLEPGHSHGFLITRTSRHTISNQTSNALSAYAMVSGEDSPHALKYSLAING